MKNPTNRLLALRTRADLSQQALSNRSGVSVQYIRLLEQQPEKMPGLDIAAALGRALSAAPLQLFPRLPRLEKETRWEFFTRVYPELCAALDDVGRLRFFIAVTCMPEDAFRTMTSILHPNPLKWDRVRENVLARLKTLVRDADLCGMMDE
jgi:transcriptional regulator with XRE-family HTH domain